MLSDKKKDLNYHPQGYCLNHVLLPLLHVLLRVLEVNQRSSMSLWL